MRRDLVRAVALTRTSNKGKGEGMVMAPDYLFNLKVLYIEQVCVFELSWGQGQRLTAQVNYPIALTRLYQDWQRAYINFYRSQPLRGRVIDGGITIVPHDWQTILAKC